MLIISRLQEVKIGPEKLVNLARKYLRLQTLARRRFAPKECRFQAGGVPKMPQRVQICIRGGCGLGSAKAAQLITRGKNRMLL
jgi:hypothetical protein